VLRKVLAKRVSVKRRCNGEDSPFGLLKRDRLTSRQWLRGGSLGLRLLSTVERKMATKKKAAKKTAKKKTAKKASKKK
jgi:hypothetical protein